MNKDNNDNKTMRTMVIDFLTRCTRLFEVVPNLSEKASQFTFQALIKGAIQSGKTDILLALALYFLWAQEHRVLLIVRNLKPDAEQLENAWTRFLHKFQDFCADHYDDDTTFLDHRVNHFTIALANRNQLHKFNNTTTTTTRLTVLMDEVDLIGYGEGEKVGKELETLFGRCQNLIGVTATMFEPINVPPGAHDAFTTPDLYFMKPPMNYTGILHFSPGRQTIEELSSSSTTKNEEDNLLHRDVSLLRFLQQHKDVEPFTVTRKHSDGFHPFLALLNTDRYVQHHSDLRDAIVSHPDLKDRYTVLTYNHNRITVVSPFFGSSITKIRLPTSHKKVCKKDSQGNMLAFRDASLREVLQYLKNQAAWTKRFPRILIIGQNLLSRGLNVVSEDYEWHLTHMFYRPSSHATITKKMQDQRMCGIFSDNLQPCLYITDRDWNDLVKGHELQEEMLERLCGSGSQKTLSLSERMSGETFYKKKFPGCRLSAAKGGRSKGFVGNKTHRIDEDKGWGMDRYDRLVVVASADNTKKTKKTTTRKDDNDDTQRLCQKMFPKWSRDHRKTNISLFMHDLDPDKVYTHEEIIAYCEEKGMKNKLGWVMTPGCSTKYAHGQILVGDANKGYRLHPELVESYKEFF